MDAGRRARAEAVAAAGGHGGRPHAPHPSELPSAGVAAGVRLAGGGPSRSSATPSASCRGCSPSWRSTRFSTRSADDRIRIAVRVVWVGLSPAQRAQLLRLAGQTQTPLILLAFVPLFVRGALRETAPRPRRPAHVSAALLGLTFLSYCFTRLRPLVLSAVSAAGISRAVRADGGGDGLDRAEASGRGARARGGARLRGDRFRSASKSAGHRHLQWRSSSGAMFAPPGSGVADARKRHGAVGAAQRQRAILRQPNHAAVRLAARRRARRGGSRFAAKGRRAYSSSTTGKRKSSAPVSRRPIGGRLEWAPIARVAGSPEVRIFQLQDGGPAPAQ